jgi:hypothetical protein
MKTVSACILAACLLSHMPAKSQVTSPSEYLNMPIGSDRTLADYGQMEKYIRSVAANSPRMQIEELGKSTLNNNMIATVISTPENLARRAEYQEIAARLSDPRGLSNEQIDELTKKGKAIVVLSANLHSVEIGSSQMVLEFVHQLAAEGDESFRKTFDNVILFLIPSLNPDGQIMITDWYRKMLGTKYEGGPLPWLYHHYVGHDNNRDWYMLTQKETRNVTRAAYKEWYPVVWMDIHQMGMNSARMFVPPYADPIAPSVDPIIWRGVNLIGSGMAWELERHGKTGVVTNAMFDVYYPGSVDSNPEFKNIYGVIIEVASVRIATPVQLDRALLVGDRKGMPDYLTSSNFPSVWPGGTWRLRDIIDYELIASRAMLDSVASEKEKLMRGAVTSAQSQIAAGKPDEYWRIDRHQRDPVAAARLAHLLQDNAIQVLATPDAYLVPTAQPLGNFASELLSKQIYPEVRAEMGGSILQPYDVTTWTLPMMMDVEVQREMVPAVARTQAAPLAANDWPQGRLIGDGAYYAVSRDSNSAFRFVNAAKDAGARVWTAGTPFSAGQTSFPKGAFIVENKGGLARIAESSQAFGTAISGLPDGSRQIGKARIGLFKPWRPSMDEGWTRWVFDQYGYTYKNIDNAGIKKGKLSANYDVIVLPDTTRDIIVDGKAPNRDGYAEELPPPYAGGIGKEGLAALRQFVDDGGTLITLRESGEVLSDPVMNMPVRNVLSGVKLADFSVPGSMLKARINSESPINYGMPSSVPVFFDQSIAYQPLVGTPDIVPQVVATYPSDKGDILLSGWGTGLDRLTDKAAAIAFQQGRGKIVMFGFGVQNRGQTEGTFKMLFNAVEWAAEK